jgi:hypothetical protein
VYRDHCRKQEAGTGAILSLFLLIRWGAFAGCSAALRADESILAVRLHIELTTGDTLFVFLTKKC